MYSQGGSRIVRKNRILIPVEDLYPGLVVAEPFFDSNGVVVIGEGIILSSKTISKLNEKYPAKSMSVLDEYLDEIFMSKENKKQKIIDAEIKLGNVSNGIKSIMNDIERKKRPSIKLVAGMSVQLMESFKDYNLALEGILRERPVDEYTQRHCVNVAILSIMLGRWLLLSDSEILLLAQSALLHDIGKVKINSNILNKPSKLSPIEFEAIKKHSIIGYSIAKEIPNIDTSVPLGKLMHHEKIDRSGYPLGLSNDKIHLFGKIIAIADIFDAMTSTRPYHSRQSPFSVLEMMQHEFWGKIDTLCLSTFVKNMSMYYEGEIVRLSNGKLGQIVKMNPSRLSAPLVMVGEDFIDLSVENYITVSELVSFPIDT